MTFDLDKILASKRAFRHELAARDIVEKLAMLDQLRARALTLQAARSTATESRTLREEPAPYPTGAKSDPP